MRRRLALSLLLSVILVTSACGGGGGGGESDQKAAAGAEELVGVFKIDPGTCDTSGPVTKGSYFRMIAVNGKPGAGPYVPNGDSPCGDKTWAPMKPGSDGGLKTGAFQPYPDPAFDDKGNGTGAAVTEPTTWFAVKFAIATNEKDPQTQAATAKPKIMVEAGKLSGDLSAYAAAWNKQNFNQGAPKPGGKRPGLTVGPSGTYDEATKAYTLDWSSQIVGGPFNNFTGVWHLEGAFEPES
jgi:hypothetical protein